MPIVEARVLDDADAFELRSIGLAGAGLVPWSGGPLGWVFAGFLILAARLALRPGPHDGRFLARTLAGLLAGLALFAAGMVGPWETAEGGKQA